MQLVGDGSSSWSIFSEWWELAAKLKAPNSSLELNWVISHGPHLMFWDLKWEAGTSVCSLLFTAALIMTLNYSCFHRPTQNFSCSIIQMHCCCCCFYCWTDLVWICWFGLYLRFLWWAWIYLDWPVSRMLTALFIIVIAAAAVSSFALSGLSFEFY